MVIDKVAWTLIEDRKVLFLRTRGKDAFYNPGGKREADETDEETLIREIKEELSVELSRDTIKYINTFSAQAHGKAEGTLVEVKCYSADYKGTLTPCNEIEEMAWLTSADREKTSVIGEIILDYLKQKDLID